MAPTQRKKQTHSRQPQQGRSKFSQPGAQPKNEQSITSTDNSNWLIINHVKCNQIIPTGDWDVHVAVPYPPSQNSASSQGSSNKPKGNINSSHSQKQKFHKQTLAIPSQSPKQQPPRRANRLSHQAPAKESHQISRTTQSPKHGTEWAKEQKKTVNGKWEIMDEDRTFELVARFKNLFNDPELFGPRLKEKILTEKMLGDVSKPNGFLSDSDYSFIKYESTRRTSCDSLSAADDLKALAQQPIVYIGDTATGHAHLQLMFNCGPPPRAEWDTYHEEITISEGRYKSDPRNAFDKPNPAGLRFVVKGGKAFHRFSELPGEIRNKIWEIAHKSTSNKSEVHIQHIVQFRGGIMEKDLFVAPPQRSHPLLYACSESRSIAMGSYKLMFGTSSCPASIPFDTEKDTLFLHPNTHGGLHEMAKQISVVDKKLIKRLAIPRGEWNDNYFKDSFTKALTMNFRNCEDLILYVADVPNHQGFLYQAKNDAARISRHLKKVLHDKFGPPITFKRERDENGNVKVHEDGSPIRHEVKHYAIPNVRIRPMDGDIAVKWCLLERMH